MNIESGGSVNNNYSSQEEENNKRAEAIFEERMDDFLNKTFAEFGNNKERLDHIIDVIKKIFNKIPDIVSKEELESLTESINDYEKEDADKEEFVSDIKNKLEPLTKIYSKNFAKVEKYERDAFNEQENFIEINAVLSYGISRDRIHLHHPPARSFAKEERMKLYKEAFTALGEVIENNKNIEIITATSYLITKDFFANMLKEYGFKIEDATRELLERHFKGEEREVKHASISREDFLERYRNFSQLKE